MELLYSVTDGNDLIHYTHARLGKCFPQTHFYSLVYRKSKNSDWNEWNLQVVYTLFATGWSGPTNILLHHNL